MINEIEIKCDVDGKTISFNRKIEPSDWRYCCLTCKMKKINTQNEKIILNFIYEKTRYILCRFYLVFLLLFLM